MPLSDLKEFVGSTGLAVALVIAACYAFWRWGWWLLTEIIKPCAVKFIEFLQHGMEAITKLTDSSEKVCDQMKQQGEKLTDHGQQLSLHGRTLEEIKGLLRK